eukprot:m.129158 g.129158  ORF g.129158 m.129158 type:complete len:1391 (+) comp23625_c0_seq2:79-4251(+)
MKAETNGSDPKDTRRIPVLYRALYDYNTGEESDLSFKAGDVICVTDTGDGPSSWWTGNIDDRSGSFPGTYVKELTQALKTFTPPEDFDENEEEGDKDIPLVISDDPQETEQRQETPPPAGKRVLFNFARNAVFEVHSRFEYDRKGEFDPAQASMDWTHEEEDEKQRIQEDRWAYFESKLPPGTKCDERIKWEKDQAEIKERERIAEENRKKERELKKKKMAEARAARKAAQQAKEQEKPEIDLPAGGETRAQRLRRKMEERKQQKAGNDKMAQAAASRSAAPPPPKPVEKPKEGSPAPPTQPATPSKESDNTPEPITPQQPPAAEPRRISFSPTSIKPEATANPPPSATPPPKPPHAHAQNSPAPQSKIAHVGRAAPQVPDQELIDQAVTQLEKHIENLGNTEGGLNGFQREWKELVLEDKKLYNPQLCTSAKKHPTFNRYPDILPYDRMRVVLNSEANIPNNPDDYINASWIKDLRRGSPDYIVSQGPTDETLEHFWKMIVQNRSRVIIMVTRVVEGGRKKCVQYWPEPGRTQTYKANNIGPEVSIEGLSEKNANSWFERKFKVSEKQADGSTCEFNVLQLHFVDWPDHNVPDSAASFLSFLHASISSYRTAAKQARDVMQPCPMTVHCSAGVGRSGVFCVVYSLINSLPHIGRGATVELDILGTIKKMRESRRYMVQTLAQLIFCYNAVLQAACWYRQGSRKSSETKPSLPDPVWLHRDIDANAAEVLLSTAPSDGKFLVRTVPEAPGQFVLSVYYGDKCHHMIVIEKEGQKASVNGATVDANTLREVIDALRLVGKEPVLPVVLQEYVPCANVDDELLMEEQGRAAEITALNHATLVSHQGGTDSNKSPLKRVRRSNSSSPGSSPRGSLKKDGGSGGRRRSFRQRASDKIEKLVRGLSPRSKEEGDRPRSNESLSPPRQPALTEAEQSAEKPVLKLVNGEVHSRLAYTSLPDVVARMSPRSHADEIAVVGRSGSLTFLNGVYSQLSDAFNERPAFRLKNPIGTESGHLAGQYVYLYFDATTVSWVLTLSGTGVVGAAPGDYSHPMDIQTCWTVLNYQNSGTPNMLQDVNLQIIRPALPKRSSSSSLETAEPAPNTPPRSSSSTSNQVQVLQQQLTAAKAREAIAYKLVQSQKSFAQRYAASQAREAELAEQVVELQQLLSDRLFRASSTASKDASDSNNVTDDVQALKQQVAQLEAAKEQMNTKMIEAQRQINALTRDNRNLKQQAEELDTIASTLQHHNDELKAELASALSAGKTAPSHEDDALVKARQAALNSADEFAIATEKNNEPKRGLPAGVLWSDDELASPEPEEQPKRGLPAGVLWDNSGDEGEEEQYVALQDFTGTDPDHLSFKQGDTIIVQHEDGDWWEGSMGDKSGKFPASYVGAKM